MRIAPILLAMAVLLLPLSRPAQAATGTVHIRVAKAGLLFGVTRADGTLHWLGENYRLQINGITAGTVGVAVIRLTGHAYHLRHASDIIGNYTVGSVSLAVGGGRKVARLQKSNSVVYLQLEGPEVGFELSAGMAGVTITIP